jgi:signal transduction histidine kinase
MDKIKNFSIRKTIVLYMLIAIIAGFFLGALAIGAAKRSQQAIWWKYANQDFFSELQQTTQSKGYYINLPRPNASEMSDIDYHLSEACDFFETYSILVFSVIGMVVAVFLFYRYKIKAPLMELNAASNKIILNELDFKISYTNKDELGTLCNQFEVMRQALYENNLCMWKMLEEQKTLRAAIAHDIRSPLAVLRGYQEMMMEFVPENRFDNAALMEMLQNGMNQIDILNRFVESMRKLSSLENREINRKKCSLNSVYDRLVTNILFLEKQTGKKAEMQFFTSKQEIHIDEDLIMEVAENLLANAFSYATEKITIELVENEDILELVIVDDGCGFLDETEQLTKAYYHSNSQDDLEHFGLGMYISRIYCEKHGGKLLTANSTSGGAIVKAQFSI